MTDTLTKEQRSSLMSRVRTRDTAPEMYVRSRVWRDGFRYRLAVKSLAGRPDIVLPRYGTTVFVHGCFWHSHACRKGRRPSTNIDMWDRKLDGNVARDRRNQRRLEAEGWRVFVIWECDLERGTNNLLSELHTLRRAQSYPSTTPTTCIRPVSPATSSTQ